MKHSAQANIGAIVRDNETIYIIFLEKDNFK